MAMHDDEFNLKENKTCIKKKKWIEPRSYKNMKNKPCLEEREGSWYKKVNHHLQLSYMYFTPSGLKNELHNNIYFLSVFFSPLYAFAVLFKTDPHENFQ